MKEHAFVRLCRARDLLRSTCASNVALPEIADAANMSTFHFVRSFQALFGQTPHRYRIQARIQIARELLARGEYSVTQTCLEVGFASVGSFSSLFSREVGMAPRAFQRAARTSVSVPGGLSLQLFPGCLSLMAQLPRDGSAIFEKSPSCARGTLQPHSAETSCASN
jgi:AraC-like DNA-binding protein